MSDILLINSNFGGQYQGIPLGALLIAAVLEEEGFSVTFKDYQVSSLKRKPDPSTFCSFMETDTDIIAISVMAPSLPTVCAAAQKFKEDHPEKTIILGGPSPTDTPVEILENFPVDIVVMGEGELTITALMEALQTETPLKEVEGICYREQENIYVNERPSRVRDLDSLPFPAYHLIDFAEYNKRADILTARGCPYACAFCSAHSVWEHHVTYRSIERVVEEIGSISGDIEMVTFADDILTLSSRRVITLCELLHSEGIDMPWSCNGRVNHVSRDMLKIMASAGLAVILYGIESGSNEILRTIGKEFTIDKARKVIDVTAEYTTVRPSYIWGFPFETIDQFFETVFCVVSDQDNPRIDPQLLFLNPLVKSPLFEQYKHTLTFSPGLTAGISRLPGDETVAEYPRLEKVISSHPELFASYYFYDHDGLDEKWAYVQNLSGSE